MHKACCKDGGVPGVAVAEESFQSCKKFDVHVAQAVFVTLGCVDVVFVEALDHCDDRVRYPIVQGRKGLIMQF